MFLGNAEQVLEILEAHGWLIVLGDSFAVEQSENARALAAFGFDALGRIGLVENFPGQAAGGAMFDIEGGAFFGVAQNLIGFEQDAKNFGIAGVTVIRMEALGEDAVDAMDGIQISVGADLHSLVIIDE